MIFDIKAFYLENGEYKKINGLHQGLPIQETVSGSLNNATIIVNSDLDELFPIWTSVKITVNDNLEWYFIAGDILTETRNTLSRPYRHTITLFEPTKYLEKVVCQSMSYTNKNDALLDQINKVLINAEPIKSGTQPRFRLSNRLIDRLSGVKGEDFFFTRPTFREVLDTMLEVVNCEVKVNEITNFNDIEIDYSDLNALGNEIEISDILKKQTVHNIEYLGTDIEAYGDNSFSGSRRAIYHPSPNGWDTFKTQEATLTSENAVMSTEFPIEEIEELFVNVECEIVYTITMVGGATNRARTITSPNIVHNVVDLETYNILKDEGVYNTDELFKSTTIYYTRGERVLGTQERTKGLFFSTSNFETAIQGAVYNSQARLDFEQELRDGWPNAESIHFNTINVINFKIEKTPYRIKYTPYIDAHVKIGKVNYDEVASTIIDNQEEKVIDLGRYGNNLYSTINRLGNKELNIDRKLYDLNDDYNKGDYFNVGNSMYILTTKEIALYNNFIKAHYAFTKDFNNLDSRIGINREKRIYNIPLENFKRDILIKEYIIASFENEGASILANNFLKVFTSDKNKPITNALVKTTFDGLVKEKRWVSTTRTDYTVSVTVDAPPLGSNLLPSANNYSAGTVGLVSARTLPPEERYYIVEETESHQTTDSDLYELSVVPYSMATSILFNFRFDDNYSAGMSTENRVIGGRKQVPNPYTNDLGEYNKIHIRLINDDEAAVPEDYETLKELPKTNEARYNLAIKHYDKHFDIKKDAYEHHSFTIQFETIGDENIIIGNAIANLNALITEEKHDLKLYVSTTEKYQRIDNQRVKGSLETNQLITIGTNNLIVDGNTLRTQFANIKSWGIADSENNLLIGVNKVENENIKTTIYFNHKEKRS